MIPRHSLLACLLVLSGLVVPSGMAQDADEDVSYLSSRVVEKGQVASDVICILCSVRIIGKATGDVITIGGDIEVIGEVEGDAVAAGGRIDVGQGGVVRGDGIAIGGSYRKTGAGPQPAEVVSAPYVHVPGQRSFHPLAVLINIAFTVLVLFLARLALGASRLDAIAGRLGPAWWLAVVFGLAGWAVFLSAEDLLAEGTTLDVLEWTLLVLWSVLAMVGFAAFVWLVGRKLSRRDGLRAWATGAAAVLAILLVPIVGAFALSILLILTLGLGIEWVRLTLSGVVRSRRKSRAELA